MSLTISTSISIHRNDTWIWKLTSSRVLSTYSLYYFILLNINVLSNSTQAKSIQNYRTVEIPRFLLGQQVNSLSTCETAGCEKAAAQILSYLNENINPCENFYQFANGNFMNDTKIPDDRDSIDSYELVSDIVQEQLRDILNEPLQITDTKPVELIKIFNSACLNEQAIEERGFTPILNILNELGGWPALQGNSWSDATFSWVETIKKFRKIGLDTSVVFSLSVESDLKNSSRRILDIYQCDHELEREYLVAGLNNEQVMNYYDSMVETAIVLGANLNVAERDLSDALRFEMKLANISLPREKLRNGTALYNVCTIKELQASYPYLDWLDYINSFLPPELDVNDNEMVINSIPTYFEQLGDVLRSTPNRTIANYLMWRVVLTTSDMLTDELREKQIRFSDEQRWKECIKLTSKHFPIPVGLLYSEKYFNDDSKRAVIDLLENVRQSFINILQTVPWMDEKTRNIAISKAKTITAQIGYPMELTENSGLDEYYENLQMEPDNLLVNYLQLEQFNYDNAFGSLRQLVIKDSWETLLNLDPTDVNAFYDPYENSIQFPPSIFQDRFFSADRPQYMNYASIGSIIGHEITHGFDDEGRQYDLNGNLFDWWNPETQQQFLQKAQCIIEQYGNYTDLRVNLSLSGINTQGENIADNGGVISAYNAYEHWVQRNGREGLLPGIKYNQKQLFWISFAQSGSSVSKESYIKDQIITDDHAPDEFRINGVVSNLEQFARDFNCPLHTKMNPQIKCRVW